MSEKRTIAPADKITVAEQYLAGKLTQTSAAKKYQVHIRTIQSWIRLYQVDGPAAFQKHGWTRYPRRPKASGSQSLPGSPGFSGYHLYKVWDPDT